ncbi:hypothetical protein HED42_09055 [Enterococcus casseliflavus]|uniref:hypothetical protein n=1 Tax=Enterococcus casseliflavus TaxID=37734 RepID=UPI001432D10D|nr:hypothetical protein [Enterococcus casseliflavus]NKD38280.1 hypothetical protein [Enterococcus casseliflavus]
MKKTYVKEMNRKQLEKLWDANENLRSRVFDAMQETEGFYIREQLTYIEKSLSDWSIDAHGYSYLRVNNPLQFLNGLLNMDASMPLFTEKQFNAMNLPHLLNKFDILHMMDYDNSNFEQLESWLADKVENIIDTVVKELQQRLSLSTLSKGDFIVDILENERLGEYYTLDNSYSTLYLDTTIVL